MEPMDIRRLTASKLELCPARDFFAGITRWCAEFSIMRPATMSFQYGNQGSIIVTPYGEPLELADTVADESAKAEIPMTASIRPSASNLLENLELFLP